MALRMNDPLLPSFTQSRDSYTYESEEDVGADSSVADSSMVSDLASLASATSLAATAITTMSVNTINTNSAVMSSPGISIPSPPAHGAGGTTVSPGGYSAKSARFKSAMTTRARQRRMRRMREREPDAETSNTSITNTPGTPGSMGTHGSMNRSVDSDISPGIPPLSGGGMPPTPTSPGSPADRVQNAKDHVEQMKSYRKMASAPVTPNTPVTPVSSNSPLQSRLYQAHRARSVSRSLESSPAMSPPSAVSDSAAGGGSGNGGNHHPHRSPSSPNLSYNSSGGGSMSSPKKSSTKNSNNHHHHNTKSPTKSSPNTSSSFNSSSNNRTTPVENNPNSRTPSIVENHPWSSPMENPTIRTIVENHPTPKAAKAVTPPRSTPQPNHTQTESRPTPVTNNKTSSSYRPHHDEEDIPMATARNRASSSKQHQQPNNNNNNQFQHPSLAQPSKPTTTRRSKRDKFEASQTKPEEFIPDWKTGGLLSPEEVRDASNFTSIQFQCSNLSGEIEMFSDEMEDTTTGNESVFSGHSFNHLKGVGSMGTIESKGGVARERQLWQNEVWVNNGSSNRNSMVSNDGHSEATTPSIFNRPGEIYHQKAASSIMSLLSADRMFEAGLMAPEINKSEEDDCAEDVNGDSPTGVTSGVSGVEGLKRMFTFDGDSDPGNSRGGEWKGTSQVKGRALFTKENEEVDEDVRRSVIFQAFRQNMMQPSSQLSELLGQIQRRNVVIDRTFATRRKNACGALKILSAKEENRMKICWTIGVLPAIASVLSDVNEVISDDISKAANTEARNRIVSTLLNLSVNKKNRMLIVNTPGVLESMSQTIQYDNGESRQGCCTVLLYLAKTAEARAMIVKSPNMLDVFAKVIEVPRIQPTSPTPKSKARSKRMMLAAQCPISPLGSGDASKCGMDDTVDTRSSFRSRRSGSLRSDSHTDDSEGDDDDDDSSHDSDSHTSGHSSHSGSHDSKTDDGDGEDDDDSRTMESSIEEEVEQMEISFQTAATAEMENTRGISSALSNVAGGDGSKKESDAMMKNKKPNEDIYDADPNRFLHGARLSVFACLLCLVKTQENAFLMAREEIIVKALIGVSKHHSSTSHSRSMAILAHLTRHPKNSHQLVFRYTSLLPMLQGATASHDKEARRYAFCALQNLSMDKSCRAPIAHSPKIIWSLTERCKAKGGVGDNDETRMAAMATLQNLSDEPANLIQFTIVKDCIGTIIQIAREDVVKCEKTDLTSFMAKNTLVTLSHWFRKIATSGSERMGNGANRAALGNMACIPVDRQYDTLGRVSPVGGSNGSPGGTRTQMLLYNARLAPTIYDQWS